MSGLEWVNMSLIAFGIAAVLAGLESVARPYALIGFIAVTAYMIETVGVAYLRHKED